MRKLAYIFLIILSFSTAIAEDFKDIIKKSNATIMGNVVDGATDANAAYLENYIGEHLNTIIAFINQDYFRWVKAYASLQAAVYDDSTLGIPGIIMGKPNEIDSVRNTTIYLTTGMQLQFPTNYKIDWKSGAYPDTCSYSLFKSYNDSNITITGGQYYGHSSDNMDTVAVVRASNDTIRFNSLDVDTDSLENWFIYILSGTGSGQHRKILSNDTTSSDTTVKATVLTSWVTPLDATSIARISPMNSFEDCFFFEGAKNIRIQNIDIRDFPGDGLHFGNAENIYINNVKIITPQRWFYQSPYEWLVGRQAITIEPTAAPNLCPGWIGSSANPLCKNIYISNSELYGGYFGIDIEPLSASTIVENINITNCTIGGSRGIGLSGLTTYFKNVIISNCTFKNITFYAVDLLWAGRFAENIIIDNCIFDSVGTGILIGKETAGLTIQNCTFHNIYDIPITSTGKDAEDRYGTRDLIIKNNKFINCEGGIHLVDSPYNLEISGNTFYNCDSSTSYEENNIFISGAVNAVIKNNVFIVSDTVNVKTYRPMYMLFSDSVAIVNNISSGFRGSNSPLLYSLTNYVSDPNTWGISSDTGTSLLSDGSVKLDSAWWALQGGSFVPLSTSWVKGEITSNSNGASDWGFLRLSAGGVGDIGTKTAIDLMGYNDNVFNRKIFFHTGGALQASVNTYGMALPASKYINFDTTNVGSAGYGIRDNSGTIELKNSGGVWTPVGADADTIIGNEVTNTTNTTLTRSGSGTSVSPYTLGLNLSAANTWAGLATYTNGFWAYRTQSATNWVTAFSTGIGGIGGNTLYSWQLNSADINLTSRLYWFGGQWVYLNTGTYGAAQILFENNGDIEFYNTPSAARTTLDAATLQNPFSILNNGTVSAADTLIGAKLRIEGVSRFKNTVTIGVTGTTWSLPLAIGTTSQFLRGDGAWAAEIGDISGITAGFGLTGSASTGECTLHADSSETATQFDLKILPTQNQGWYFSAAAPTAISTAVANGEIRGKLTSSSDFGFLRLSAGAGTTLNTFTGIDLIGYQTAGIANVIRGYTNGAEKFRIDVNGIGIRTGLALRFYDADTSHYVSFVAPSLSSNVAFTLPSADGSGNNIFLKTNGSGALSFGAEVGDISGITAGFGLTGSASSGECTLHADSSEVVTVYDLGLKADVSHNQAASTITSGTLLHERGGLEADVSAYSGLVKIAAGITSAVTDASSNWNTAYGWGNHASAGYLTSETGDISNVSVSAPVTGGGGSGSVTIGVDTTAATGGARVATQYDIHNLPTSQITTGTFLHERGGLEADVSAYNGLVKISSGATSAVTVPSGALVGTTATQTLTNKTFGNNTTFTRNVIIDSSTFSSPPYLQQAILHGLIHSRSATGSDWGFLRLKAGGSSDSSMSAIIDLQGYSDVSGANQFRLIVGGKEGMRMNGLQAIEFYNGARAKKRVSFGANEIVPMATNGATKVDWGLGAAYQFPWGSEKFTTITWVLPTDLDSTSNITLTLLWSSPIANTNMQWDVDFLFRNTAEAMNSSTPDTTITKTVISCATPVNGLTITEFTALATKYFSSDKILILRIKRDGDDAADVLEDYLYLTAAYIEYTSNKLGSAP